MRKQVLTAIGIWWLISLLCLGCGKEKAPETYSYSVASEGGFYTEVDGMQIFFNEGCMPEAEDRDIAVYRVKTALEDAKKFLGTSFASIPISCCFHSEEGATQVEAGALNIYYFDTVEQPYVNYMIQALLGEKAPDWLREGIATYGAEEMGESQHYSYAFDIPSLQGILEQEEAPSLHELAMTLHNLGIDEEAEKLGDMIQGIADHTSAEGARQYRAAYSIYAGSFVQYLAEKNGFDALIRLYNGDNFQAVMTKAFHTYYQEWKIEVLANYH